MVHAKKQVKLNAFRIIRTMKNPSKGYKLTLFVLAPRVCFLYGSCWNQRAPRSTVEKQWGKSNQDTMTKTTHKHSNVKCDGVQCAHKLGNAVNGVKLDPKVWKKQVSKSVIISLTGTFCSMPKEQTRTIQKQDTCASLPRPNICSHHRSVSHRHAWSLFDWNKPNQWRNWDPPHRLWTHQRCTYCGRITTEA